MKNLSLTLSTLAFIGVAALLVMHFNGSKTVSNPSATPAANATTLKIAYVDMDSLEANYDYLKAMKEDFKNSQAQAESELEKAAQQMQNEANQMQNKMQSGNMTKPEYEAAQKRLEQMQQALATRKQALSDQLLEKNETINKDLKSKLDSFIEAYNKDKHYDYILSYGSGSNIIYTNKGLDITKDVIKGMNELAKGYMDKKNK